MDLDEDKPRLGTHRFGSVPGYIATFKGKKWFYLTAGQLRGSLAVVSMRSSSRRNWRLTRLLDRAPNGRYVVQRPIFSGAKGNKGHKWVHAFRASP